MPGRIEFRDSDDPWRWHQPPYESLVMRGPGRFALTARLPSGERVDMPLASRVSFDMRVDPPPGDSTD